MTYEDICNDILSWCERGGIAKSAHLYASIGLFLSKEIARNSYTQECNWPNKFIEWMANQIAHGKLVT